MSYSIAAITAIIIHVILNDDYFRNKEEKNEVTRAFKQYIFVAFGYYVVDALWGIIYEFQIPAMTYIISVLYYVIMAGTVVLMCRYVTIYLSLHNWFGKLINYFGIALAIFEVGILVFNHFNHLLFFIDSEGVYHANSMRYVALYMQLLLCVLVAIQSGTAIKRTNNEMKKRFFAIFMFCVEMAVAIGLQIIYPLYPIYSIGLVVGISIIHSLVYKSEKEKQYMVLASMADIYYSMHVIDLVNDTVEEFNAKNEVKEVVNSNRGATQMMVKVMTTTTVDSYKTAALEFTDLTTLPDRMKGKKNISAQFVGNRTGWFLAMFITIETDVQGRPTKVIYTTRIIDEEKKQEERLIHKSQTDELTGVFNRMAYEEHIYEMKDIPDNFIYIALDVNGLKVVNDTIGHAAGDEMIIGAGNCMKKAFNPYGRVYRTGGDEFVAIVLADEDKLKEILAEFDEAVSSWSGNLVDSLTISYGYVSRKECPDYSAPQFATEADKRMYKAKSEYYRKKGVDRRGQQDAHKALCETYTKILKINLSDDSYRIINMYDDEKDTSLGFSDSISDWLHGFGLSGQVHPEDLDDYLDKTSVEYMKEYFKTNTTHIITYRRKYGDIYKHVMMEMIPANDYSEDNQSLFLYVKNIEK